MTRPSVDPDQLRALRTLRDHFGDVQVVGVVASAPLLAEVGEQTTLEEATA